MSLRHCGLGLALLLLAGCAGLPEAPPDSVAVQSAWALRQQQLGSVQGFEVNGRVAVKGGGLSGALRWEQDGEAFKLRIAGPFGAGALSIQGTPALVAIKGKDIDLVTDAPQQVLAKRTGWRLPLDALRWWVLGLPAPAVEASITLDAEGRAVQMQQGDWQLRYSDYRSDAESAPALPGRIEAVQGEWTATVVVEAIHLKP
ncbi:MAG: lipoprotein insertase outer membrane protein LolB [Pseudomonadota bacterium]